MKSTLSPLRSNDLLGGALKKREAQKHPTKVCPECKRKMEVLKGKFPTHGPGKDDFICPGSGREA